MANELTVKQSKFVAAYCSGKSATAAAIEAGYAESSARTRGYDLLHQVPAVMEAVKNFRQELREATNYDAEAAMAELEDGLKFSKETKNATALAKFTELKMKMSGLLDKKDEGNAEGFSINIIGLSPPGSPIKDISNL